MCVSHWWSPVLVVLVSFWPERVCLRVAKRLCNESPLQGWRGEQHIFRRFPGGAAPGNAGAAPGKLPDRVIGSRRHSKRERGAPAEVRRGRTRVCVRTAKAGISVWGGVNLFVEILVLGSRGNLPPPHAFLPPPTFSQSLFCGDANSPELGFCTFPLRNSVIKGAGATPQDRILFHSNFQPFSLYFPTFPTISQLF